MDNNSVSHLFTESPKNGRELGDTYVCRKIVIPLNMNPTQVVIRYAEY